MENQNISVFRNHFYNINYFGFHKSNNLIKFQLNEKSNKLNSECNVGLVTGVSSVHFLIYLIDLLIGLHNFQPINLA